MYHFLASWINVSVKSVLCQEKIIIFLSNIEIPTLHIAYILRCKNDVLSIIFASLYSSFFNVILLKGVHDLHLLIFFKCTEEPTSYLSLFLHRQNFELNFFPHRKCVNRDKIGFATKQRKLQLNRFCNKTAQIPSMPRQNSVNYTILYSIHLKFLHIQNVSTYKMSHISHLRYLHI